MGTAMSLTRVELKTDVWRARFLCLTGVSTSKPGKYLPATFQRCVYDFARI